MTKEDREAIRYLISEKQKSLRRRDFRMQRDIRDSIALAESETLGPLHQSDEIDILKHELS